jgi:hypothetical protein
VKAELAEQIEIRELKNRKSDVAMANLQACVEAGVISWEEVKERFEVKEEGRLGVVAPADVKISLPGNWKVIAVRGAQALVTNGQYTGYTPIVGNPDVSWLCFNCNHYGPWSGARCLTCGALSDPE